MADEQQQQTQAAPKRKPAQQASEPQGEAQGGGYEEATEQGFIGQVAEDPPNEAYQVDADHKGTAEAERKARHERRLAEAEDSREGD